MCVRVHTHTHVQIFPGFLKWKEGEIWCFWKTSLLFWKTSNELVTPLGGQRRVRGGWKGLALTDNSNPGQGSQMILSFLICKVRIKYLLCLFRKIIYVFYKSSFSRRFFQTRISASSFFLILRWGSSPFLCVDCVVPRDMIIHIFSLILNALWQSPHLFRNPHLKHLSF